MKTSTNLLLILLFFLISKSLTGQSRIDIIRSEGGKVESIVFHDSLTGGSNTFNPLKNNSYANLNLKRKNEQGKNQDFDLGGYDKRQIISSHFPDKAISNENINKLSFKEASTSMYVKAFTNGVVISYNLNFFDFTGNLIGIKSKLLVLDDKGSIISNLPENSNGYFEPELTKDKKYIACKTGDISPHSDYNLIDLPEFKIYETKTGREIFSIKNSPEYSILSPSVQNNFIVEVLRLTDGVYEYVIIFPQNRIVYRKKYNRDEIGRLIRIDSTGLVFKAEGQESTDLFSNSFKQSNF